MTFRKDLDEQGRERTSKLAEEKEGRGIVASGAFQPEKIFICQLYRGGKWRLRDLPQCVQNT